MSGGGKLWNQKLGDLSSSDRAAQTPDYLGLQSPAPTNLLSPLRGEQQIGETSPNNHRYLFRGRKADIYHRAKGREGLECV